MTRLKRLAEHLDHARRANWPRESREVIENAIRRECDRIALARGYRQGTN